MSVQVCIDGRPARELADYRHVLEVLGPTPNAPDRSFRIWTEDHREDAALYDIGLNLSSDRVEGVWRNSGAATISTKESDEGKIDRIQKGNLDVSVRHGSNQEVAPEALAAFLAHGFDLVDAWMLARTFNGREWPYNLAEFPVPVGGPRSGRSFAELPRDGGLYAVVPTTDWIARLTVLQVPVLQLRDKQPSSEVPEHDLQRAIRQATDRGSLLFINDHWQLAIRLGAYGVHLGQEDIETADLDAIRSAGLRLGISTHGIYELLRAHACRPSYIAIGAIYATATKEMPTSPQGLHRLRHYVKLMSPHYPLVAIGGLDHYRISDVWNTGVDYAAVLRAIVNAPDYAAATAELLALVPGRFATGVAP
jgi:thiamine-phosphate pyrophosphorylase